MARPAVLLAVLGILAAASLGACGPAGLSSEMASGLRDRAQAYGCKYQSTQVVAETVAQSPDQSAPLQLDDLPAAPLLACRYDPHNPEVGGPAPAIWTGTLTDAVISHDTLAVRTLMAQINAAPSATGPCGYPQSRFATLTTFHQDLLTEITVELGGCYRAVVNTDPHHVRQLDAGAVALLLGPPSVN
jgi:hypothetical protein